MPPHAARVLLRNIARMDAVRQIEAGTHGTDHCRFSIEPHPSAQAIHRLDASAVRTNEVAHAGFFQPVSRPVNCGVGRCKQMNPTDNRDDRLAFKAGRGSGDNVDNTRVATPGNDDKAFGRL